MIKFCLLLSFPFLMYSFQGRLKNSQITYAQLHFIFSQTFSYIFSIYSICAQTYIGHPLLVREISWTNNARHCVP